MNLCHIYYKQSLSKHKQALLDAYEDSISIDIDQKNHLENEYSIYIVELQNVDKALSVKIKTFFENVKNPLIYFLIPKEYSISLFQLAFIVNAKSIITTNQDIGKVLVKIKNDYENHIEFCKGIVLGESLKNHLSYILFKDQKLIFASDNLLIILTMKH